MVLPLPHRHNTKYLEINKNLERKKCGTRRFDLLWRGLFRFGKSSLKQIELTLLGDVKVNHLTPSNHFGRDTISLARMGAKSYRYRFVPDAAIFKTNDLGAELDVDTRFICCDVYGLPKVLDEKFDIIYIPMAPSAGCRTWKNGLGSSALHEARRKLCICWISPHGVDVW